MTSYLAPSLARLRSQVNATYPGRSKVSDGWIGDDAHQAGVSDHNPDPKTGVVRALDLTATAAQAHRIRAATEGNPKVAYVIYDRQIWTPGQGRHAYKGSNPHSNHVHVSLKHTSEAENTLDNWKGLDMPGMCSPIRGYVSSEYGNRGGFIHAGIDIATGGVQRVVYAAYAGTLSNIVRGRAHKQPATQGTVVAPGRSGNGGRVNNPDGETQVYIHTLFDSKWKNGMKVRKGERLGVIDLSGNTTGYHLHFETWNASGTTRNPRVDFRFHGVAPGEAPVPLPAPPKPSPAPTPPSNSKKRKGPSGQGPADTAGIQRALKAAGYDVGPVDEDYGPRLTKAVKAWQTDQNKWGAAGLVADGDWWTYSQRWFEWVKQLQQVLPAWRGVPNLVIDGSYAKVTHNAVRTLQSNNGLHPDGFAQNKTTTYMRSHGSNIPNRPRTRP